MIDIKNKKVYFSGKGDQLDYKELEKFLLQNNVEFVPSIEQSELIIEGGLTPLHIQDKIFTASQNGTIVISIEEFEQFYSKSFSVNSTLMAAKLTKDNERLVKLLQNKYFDDETFIKILKQYDFKNIPLYDTDESRDVCRSIVNRFCKLVNRNHNIQYAPIGIYYTALETFNDNLLDIIYYMPSYSISDRTAKDEQPLSLKEVVALNPNSSRAIQIQILKNNNKDELIYLARNTNIAEDIKKALKDKNNDDITIALIKEQNYILDSLDDVLSNETIKKVFLKHYTFDNKIFDELLHKNLNDIDIINLSYNQSLSTSMINKLEEKNIDNSIIVLLKHNNISINLINKYLKQNDKIYNIAIAHNTKLDEEIYEKLFSLNDNDVNISLAQNISVSAKILQELHKYKNRNIDIMLCQNISTPINILMQLQLDNELKLIVKENITYQKFAEQMLGFQG